MARAKVANLPLAAAIRRIHILIFCVSMSTALVAYVESSFLKERVGEESVGTLFTVAYLLAIAAMLFLSQLVGRFGKRMIFSSACFLLWVALIVLALPVPSGLTITFFVVLVATTWIVTMGLDLALEQHSRDATTGSTRGMYLTAMNLGWVVTPLIMGFIAQWLGLRAIFLLSAIVTLPLVFFFSSIWKSSDDRKLHHKGALWDSVREIVSSPALWRIHAIAFVHQLFFAWMVIYLPLHLREGMGFSWWSIGLIFSVMLLPFVLLEFPAGRIADRWLGEKELLVGGMIIMGISTIVVGRLNATTILPWMSWLFVTRIGASLIESMRDSYFYKHVDSDDVATIIIFHATWLMAYVVGPMLATIFLRMVGYSELFQILGAIVLCSTVVLWRFPDTK